MASSERNAALSHVWWIEKAANAGSYNVPTIAVAKITSADSTTSFTSATAEKTVRVYGAVYDEDFAEDSGVGTFTAQATPGDWSTPVGGDNINNKPYATSGSGTGLLCNFSITSSNPTFTITNAGKGYQVGDTVTFKEPGSRSGTSVTLTIATLTVPTGAIGLTEAPNIPSQFHEGLVHYVIMKGYEDKISQNPDSLQKAGYFRNYWNTCVRMGTQFANRSFDNTGFNIKPADGFLM